MPRVTFSNDDILRSKLVSVGWHPVLVKSFEEDAAKTDGSALYIYSIVVDGGPFNGVPIRYQISEKAIGMGVEFLEACGVEVKAGVPIEVEKVVGRRLEGFVQRKEYQGKPQNDLVQFRKRKDQTAA